MKEPQIAALLTPILASVNLDLEAVDLIPAGKRTLLRVVVDGDGATGRGPNLDDIAEATRAISDALDEADVTGTSAYTLEVSSRGVGRPLELPRHWRRNIGRLVVVSLHGGGQLSGRIRSSTDELAVLDLDGVARTLTYPEVARAQVQVELDRRPAEPPDPGDVDLLDDDDALDDNDALDDEQLDDEPLDEEEED